MDTAIRTSSSPLLKSSVIAAAAVAAGVDSLPSQDSGEDCWHPAKPKGNKRSRKARNKAVKAARRRNRR